MNALIVSEDSKLLGDIQRECSGIDALTSADTLLGSLVGVQALPSKAVLDVLILDCSHDAHRELAELERLAPLHPGLNTILVVSQESSDVLLRALRMGVREVVKVPFSRDDFQSALRRIEGLKLNSDRAQGRVVGLISCKGGSGATFLATNLGYALAAERDKRVLLIDLNLQFGDAALFVSDRKPPATVLDVARSIRTIDAALIRSSMVEVLPNFGVLAAPEDPTQTAEIRPAQIDTLIRFARSQFDFVLLDIGRSLDGVSVQALDAADQIYPVSQLMMPYIRDGRRLLALFRSLGYPREKIRPIVNRYEKSSELTIADLESAIAAKVFATIPNHYHSVAASVNQGIPIQKLARRSPVSASLTRLAELVDAPGTQAGQGWLSRLIGRG